MMNDYGFARRTIRFLIASHLVLIMEGCGHTYEISSTWNPGEVEIDGSAEEWSSHLGEVGDTHVLLGIRNDGEYAYLCLIAPEQEFRQTIMMRGVTLWFESEGGEKFGVHYPMGMRARGASTVTERAEPAEHDEREGPDLGMLQDVEILGPGENERAVFSPLDIPGIRVKLGSSHGSTIYELAVPLVHGHPYAIGSGAGSTARLTIETGKMEEEPRHGGGMQGGEGMSGEHRSGRRGPGNGRQGREPVSSNRSESLSFRANIHFSPPPAGDTPSPEKVR
jgi:hypothetical protein